MSCGFPFLSTKRMLDGTSGDNPGSLSINSPFFLLALRSSTSALVRFFTVCPEAFAIVLID